MEDETKKDAVEKTVEIEQKKEAETKTAEVVNNSGKGLSIASLVLGIVSVVFCYNWFIALVSGILAIIFGLKGKQKEEGKGMAKAGLILGIIGVSLFLFVIIIIGSIIGLGTAAILSI